MKKKDRDRFLFHIYDKLIKSGESFVHSSIIASELNMDSRLGGEIASYWIKLGVLDNHGFGGGNIIVRLTPIGINLIEESSASPLKSILKIGAWLIACIGLISSILGIIAFFS